MADKKVVWKKWESVINDFVGDIGGQEIEYYDSFTYDMKNSHNKAEEAVSGYANHIFSITRLFNIWQMETNFPITKTLFQNIARVNGVELLNPISDYRLQVGFANLFDVGEVKAAIEKVLIPNQNKIDKDLTKIHEHLTKSKKYEVWAICLDKEGRISILNGKDTGEVNSQMSKIDIEKSITSWGA